LYEKKRGNRRTGSSKLGSAGEAGFHAALLVIGSLTLAWIIQNLVVQQWRVNYEFIEQPCVVLDTNLGSRRQDSGRVYRPEIKIRYEVDGRAYTTWTHDIATARDMSESYTSDRAAAEAVRDQFSVGAQYLCWYDPTDPIVAVVSRGYPWWVWVAMVVPSLFVLVGGGGLLYAGLTWGKSAERRAALAQRTTGSELLRGNGHCDPDFPTVPAGGDIINSPGTRLKYRLPVGTSPGWALLGLTALTILWNGTVAVFATLVVRGHLAGQADWYASAFLIPFVVVGILLIALLVRELIRTTAVGPTRVEISDHPLHPGGRYDLLITQSGKLRIRSFEVLLVCEERATYRQGTNSRTERTAVFRGSLFRREGFEVTSDAPFETQCELAIPPEAMHSFKAEHNAIQWRLIVRSKAARWPTWQRDFPLLVQPPRPARAP
jgi:hypothetical protein